MQKPVKNSIVKMIFSLFYLLFFPWFLKYIVFVDVSKKQLALAVVLGFLFATVRSCVKNIRQQRGKDLIDLIPSYLINYPITLISIFVIGSYVLTILKVPGTVAWIVLFDLGFAADSVFNRGDILEGLLKKTGIKNLSR